MVNSEQYAGHSAISLESTPIFAAKLHGFIHLVDSFRGWEGDIDAISFGKAWSKIRLKLSPSPRIDR